MKKVIFFSDSHTYWLDSDESLLKSKIIKDPGIIKEIPSVGSFFGKFIPDFDEDYWLTNGAIKVFYEKELSKKRKESGSFKPHSGYIFPEFLDKIDHEQFLIERNKLKEFWKFKRVNSAFLGTKFHKEREEEAKNRGWIDNPWTGERFLLKTHEKFFDNESICENLFDLEEGAYTELLVFDLDLWVAGQIDEVFIKGKGKNKKVWISDHKTNEKRPEKSDIQNCFHPLEHLNASKHTKYSLQVSIYAYILQKAGFKIQDIGYTFYKNYNVLDKEHIKCDKLFDECAKIFDEQV